MRIVTCRFNSITYLKMGKKFALLFLCAVFSCSQVYSWNTFNCPAPRAPDNGLSFIFRDGEVIHFRCHPGYIMRGTAIVHCVKNMWTHPAPECIPIKNYRHSNHTLGREVYHHRQKFNPGERARENLFDWDSHKKKHGVYGDGPRRLPLINGIWPPQEQVEQVLTLGPQSTPGPQTMIKEEVDIAELRHQQLEELKRLRYPNQELRGQKRKNRKQAITNDLDTTIPQETVVGLGSTEDGQVLSVSLVNTGKDIHRHRLRHHRRGNRRNRKKLHYVDPGYSNYITSRTSRVNTGGLAPYHTRHHFRSWLRNNTAELRRRPVEQIQKENITQGSLSTFDKTCVEYTYGRSIPKLAPQIRNAFVYHYETKKNKNHPFNTYMEVKYRCFTGFHFSNPAIQTLLCKNGKWVGDRPECMENITRG